MNPLDTLRIRFQVSKGEAASIGEFGLHIVHKEWLKIAIEAKLHIFHLGKGDFCLAGGIPGTGSEVVPPLGSEMAETLAEVALAMRDAKEILGTRRYGMELDEAGHPLPALLRTQAPRLLALLPAVPRLQTLLPVALLRTVEPPLRRLPPACRCT